MSVLRKIFRLTRRGHIRSVDILKELALDKDTEVLRTRRISDFGHVTRVDWRRCPYMSYCTSMFMATGVETGLERDG